MTTLQLIKAAAKILAERHDTKFCKTWRDKQNAANTELAIVAFREFRRKIAELPDNFVTQGYQLSCDPFFEASFGRTYFSIDTKKLAPYEHKKLKKLQSPDHRNAYCFEQELRRLVALKAITRKQLKEIIRNEETLP